jgi:hypothetical protein
MRRKELWEERHKDKGGPTCPTPGAARLGVPRETVRNWLVPNGQEAEDMVLPASVISEKDHAFYVNCSSRCHHRGTPVIERNPH